uniref:Acyl-coenzyme A oxidase n=1 Tax=Populus trichocarpa TaxID=3694 RepID=A0A2K1WRX5_POPTR
MAPSSLLLYTLLISANNYCPRTQKPRKTRQKMAQESSINRASRRTRILNNHLVQSPSDPTSCLRSNSCLSYTPPEETESLDFDTKEMRKILDLHNLEDRDWLFGVIKQGKVFNGKERGGRLFVLPEYNQTMEQQREMTMKRIEYLFERGVFDGWLMKKGVEAELKKLAFLDVIQNFDQSLAVMLGVHFFLWGGAIQFMGTKRHHDKWLRDTETFGLKGCFSMTELGHGSNVRGIETVTTYDLKTGEFVINTPCESAQKYWIGGAANHATHTIVFSQLNIDGVNQGVHAFIAQIRDADGNICPNIRIAECGHKIGLNGVDNGRIWFDNLRIPRENLLNSVADVSPDGQYLSAIKDPDQRFAAFLAPLTSGRVTIATSAVFSSKVGLATAIRYSLGRRAFSVTPNGPEVLLLDYPSHQRRLLPLLAKSYAMTFGGNYLKMIYVNRTPGSAKTLHVVSSAFKAIFTWHNMRTLQECREACGGQGLKTENKIGHLKGEFDVQSTFEGDNNVLMQQVSKALLSEYAAAKKKNKPFKGLGLEHMNGPVPVIPSNLTSSTLRSSQFQMNAFCLRERDLLNRFAAEVSLYQSKGESKEHAFILSYQLAEDLGRAFSDRAILQTFIDAEANVSAGSLKNVLGLLRSMYALICLEEDAAFLRYGYLSTDNAAAVRKEVTKLCGELRPHALALVSSLGIPDAFLGPIAFNWIDANSWSSVKH